MGYVANIGLEVHVQLDTKSKMFCGCSTAFGAPPNTNVCPVCLGYPGAIPTMNEEAVRKTVLTGLAIGAEIPQSSRFDRKSYFYPDMPKNFQISQYDRPFCIGGSLEIKTGGRDKAIRITRIHLEEDVAKNVHFHSASGVDFNRAGVPLMEIVTCPDINSPQEALDFLLALKGILEYLEVSKCNLEEGNIRCDINCSVRPESQVDLGVKTEIKNMNTFKGVFHALEFEISRQIRMLEEGGSIVQETRRWDQETGATYPMRTKEDAHDYRYFPEPDLLPVILSRELIEEWKSYLPELPAARRKRLSTQYGIPDYDAGVISSDREMADFFESVACKNKNFKAISNWLMTDMLRLLSETGKKITQIKITHEHLAELISLIDDGVLSSSMAKDVFAIMFETGGSPRCIAESKGFVQLSDESELKRYVAAAIEENPKTVDDFKRGKTAALKYLIGQVMRLSKGKANPRKISELIERALNEGL